MRKDFLIGFLTALVLSLGVMFVVSHSGGVEQAFAGGGGAVDGIIALTGQINNNQKEVLYIVDTSRKTAGVYEYDGRSFNLKGVRHFAYDLQLNDYPSGTQNPSVEAVRTGLEKKSGN